MGIQRGAIIQKETINFNETLTRQIERAMQYYFKATLVNTHDVLQNVWAAMVQAYLDGNIDEVEFNYLVDELTEPLSFEDPLTGQEVTFTLDYAIKIGPYLTQAEITNALLREWEDAARQKYQYVYIELQEILNETSTVITTPVTTTITTTVTTTETTTETVTETTPVVTTVTDTVTETVTHPTTITTTLTIVSREEALTNLMIVIMVLTAAILAMVIFIGILIFYSRSRK